MKTRLLERVALVILAIMHTSQSLTCYSNLTSISLAEFDVKDLRIHPLILRSNALVQCGNDGSSDNFCVIDGTGTHGIIIDPYSFGFADSSTSNVTIQGVTVDYFAPNKYFSSPVTLGLTSGDVTFMDCIFSNNFGDSIFSIQQYVFSRRLFQSEQNTYPATAKVASEDVSNQKPKSSLKFIFKSCKFKVRNVNPHCTSVFQ
jgi:hypothetical protein